MGFSECIMYHLELNIHIAFGKWVLVCVCVCACACVCVCVCACLSVCLLPESVVVIYLVLLPLVVMDKVQTLIDTHS